MEDIAKKMKYGPDGLIPAVVTDIADGEVLMLAYMNEESLRKTINTGKMTYWSRSRQKFWVKGETSGNIQVVKEIRADCDKDCLLFKVEQKGRAACHTGYKSCFFNKYIDGQWKESGEKVFNPDDVYGNKK
ncbi:MAG: phosphoribosyl-AMP cyclohydrolase [bacterium]|nr:phosphoribosyl-AMP cyclohydrolase [bacterium]